MPSLSSGAMPGDSLGSPVPLYGGAVTMSMPARFVDVSDFRPVPDHQEVWADSATDQSLVFEIVFYFEDMAQMNDSAANSMEQVEALAPASIPALSGVQGFYACVVLGTQLVAKERQGDEARNHVIVALAVLRLPQVGSDLLVTLNAPLRISASSSSAEHAGAGVHQDAFQAKPLLLAMLSTLHIHDWGLFGG